MSLVQRDRNGVVRSHFEVEVLAAAALRLIDEPGEQTCAQTLPLRVRRDRDRLHIRLVRRIRAQAGVRDDAVVSADNDIVTRRPLGQLAPEHRRRPRLVTEELILENHHRLDVPPAHLAHRVHRQVRLHAGSTDFGRPGGVASGRRKYIGSRTSDSAPLLTFVATRCATSVADAAASCRCSNAAKSCGYNETAAPTTVGTSATKRLTRRAAVAMSGPSTRAPVSS